MDAACVFLSVQLLTERRTHQRTVTLMRNDRRKMDEYSSEKWKTCNQRATWSPHSCGLIRSLNPISLAVSHYNHNCDRYLLTHNMQIFKQALQHLPCIGRESNPGQLLGKQLCSPLYHQCHERPCCNASAHDEQTTTLALTSTDLTKCEATMPDWYLPPLHSSIYNAPILCMSLYVSIHL